MALDPDIRVELETLAEHWREVHPAGGTYLMDMMVILDRLRAEGQVTADEAVDILMRASKYATHESDGFSLP